MRIDIERISRRAKLDIYRKKREVSLRAMPRVPAHYDIFNALYLSQFKGWFSGTYESGVVGDES